MGLGAALLVAPPLPPLLAAEALRVADLDAVGVAEAEPTTTPDCINSPAFQRKYKLVATDLCTCTGPGES